MEAKHEAIILVPGMMKSVQNVQRGRLVDGLTMVSEQKRVESQESSAVEGVEGVQLHVTPRDPNRQASTVDIYEAYWGDLIPRLSQEKLLVRVRRGATLLFYWAAPRVLRGIQNRIYLTFSFVTTAAILVAWYYGTVALFFTAVGEDPSLIAGQQVDLEVGANTAALQEQVAVFIGRVGAWMGGVTVWVIVAFVIGFVPVNRIVDISDFTRRYLKNETVDDGPAGLKDQLRNRVRYVVDQVCEAGTYERITVAAHSFGCMIAVDVLADYHVPDNTRLRFVTMGSPLEILSHRANWVEEEIKRCASSKDLEEWIDFYSDVDWFCSKVPFDALCDSLPPRLEQHEVHEEAPLADKLTGKTHQRYFGQQRLVHTLLRETDG